MNPFDKQQADVMEVKDWIITILISSIPIVNIIMLFVWGFGESSTNPNKKNWAKAMLIWIAIAMVIYFVIFMFLGAALLSSVNFD